MSEERREIIPVQRGRVPVIAPGHTFATVTDKISTIVLTRKTPLFWLIPFLISCALLMVFLAAVSYLFAKGVRDLGHSRPGDVGLGHHQLRMVDRNRTCRNVDFGDSAPAESIVAELIDRFAEAITLFAVASAGMFPLTSGPPLAVLLALPVPQHYGRPAAIPQSSGLGRVRVSTDGTVSLLFWFVGLIPNLATLRNRTRNRWAKATYGILAMAWRGQQATGRNMRRRRCCSPVSLPRL